MKKMFSFILVLALCVFLCACKDQRENDKHENRKNNNLSFDDSEIIDSTDFSGGYAWIHIKVSDNKSKVALIDTDFNEIYSAEYYSQSFDADFGQTVGYYYNFETDVCTIVNAEGEVVATSENGEFDSVVCCGDQSLLVYKYYPADYSQEEEERYGFINDSGNWTIYDLGYGGSASTHLGDDIFFINARKIVNPVAGLEGTVDYSYARTLPSRFVFQDGRALLVDYDSWESEYTIWTTDTNFELLDSTIESGYSYGYYACNNVLIGMPERSYYDVIIEDVFNDVYVERWDLNDCSNIIATNFASGYSMITFTGVDEKNYFALIDTEGEDIIAPTECDDAKYSEGIVVYSINEEVIGMNTEGEILFKNKPYMTSAFEFHNGIGRVSATIFVNTEGEIILGSE